MLPFDRFDRLGQLRCRTAPISTLSPGIVDRESLWLVGHASHLVSWLGFSAQAGVILVPTDVLRRSPKVMTVRQWLGYVTAQKFQFISINSRGKSHVVGLAGGKFVAVCDCEHNSGPNGGMHHYSCALDSAYLSAYTRSHVQHVCRSRGGRGADKLRRNRRRQHGAQWGALRRTFVA